MASAAPLLPACLGACQVLLLWQALTSSGPHPPAGSHKEGDAPYGCVKRCYECSGTLITDALPEGGKIVTMVQDSGRVLTRYHCRHKSAGGAFSCGQAGTCNLPVSTLEGARAQQQLCSELVMKLEADDGSVAFLLKKATKAKLLAKFRKASEKHAKTVMRMQAGEEVEGEGDAEEEGEEVEGEGDAEEE